MTLETTEAPRLTVVPQSWLSALDTVTDREAFASAKTVDEMLEAAGQAWQVYSAPVTAELAGGPALIDNAQAIVRDDTHVILSIMGSRYKLLQNASIYELGRALVDDHGLEPVGAGEFGGGKIVWAQFRLPKHVKVEGDPSAIEPMLLIFTSHDGSRPFGAVVTTIRVVCRNTFNAAISGANNRFSVKHTPSADWKLGEARRVLGLSFAYLDTFEKVMDDLVGRPMTRRDFEKFTEKLLPIPETAERPFKTEQERESLRAIYAGSDLLDGLDLTAYRAFNAVTEWADHHRTYHETKQNAKADNKALSLFDGQAAKLKSRALDLLN
jgi:phage/plasmid-like protein (TIGR03299 family)